MNIWTILIAIVVFSALIFVHELGHFLVAKWAKVKVNEFAVGMGPVLLKTQKGETQYALRAFPIGGFCAMEGESDESEDSRAFCNVSIGKRMLISATGPAMNLVLGFILLCVLSTQVIGTTQIGNFYDNARSASHLEVGDVITRVNGHRVRTNNDLNYYFMRNNDGIIDLEVQRNGEKLTLYGVEFDTHQEGKARILIVDFRLVGVKPTFTQAVGYAGNWTVSLMRQVWGSLYDLITGRFELTSLSGPVGVTSAIGQASSMGWKYLLEMVSFISVNLAVFNLLPIPALDGGRIIFLGIEAIRRKPFSIKVEGVVNGITFLMLIGLVIFATVNDVIRLF